MLAVTTFHPQGFTKYGKRCLQTLAEFFPGKVVAYYEERPDFEHPNVELRDFFSIPGASEYLERIKRVAGSDGFCPAYNFNYDASKFCRKVFAQDACFDEDSEVFWIDADSVALKPIPADFLSNLVASHPFCYLGRKGPGSYTETGFVGFNTKHEKFAQFRSKYLSYFTTGKIFSNRRGWHDCIAFDIAREGIEGKNLSPGGTGMIHVLIQSVLAPYLDHLKGPRRKDLGYSPGHPTHGPTVLGDGERRIASNA